jgi:hypothetical protein
MTEEQKGIDPEIHRPFYKYEGDPDDHRPLTHKEVEQLRKILESDARMEWLWASVRIWAGWIVGAPVALYAAWEAIQHFMGVSK